MDNAVSNRIEFMGYDHNTANSPQKQGITGSGDGVALSYDSGLYGVQFGIARADSCPFIRIREDGSWKPWSNVALKSDLPNLKFAGQVKRVAFSKIESVDHFTLGIYTDENGKNGISLDINAVDKTIGLYKGENGVFNRVCIFRPS